MLTVGKQEDPRTSLAARRLQILALRLDSQATGWRQGDEKNFHTAMNNGGINVGVYDVFLLQIYVRFPIKESENEKLTS
jgi:hypothetical protein